MYGVCPPGGGSLPLLLCTVLSILLLLPSSVHAGAESTELHRDSRENRQLIMGKICSFILCYFLFYFIFV